MHAISKPPVLIVDDDQEFCVLAEAWIRSSGHPTQVVNDLAGALRWVENGGHGIICLDLGLPDTFGTGGVDKLRNAASECPVIVVSADDSVDSVRSAIQLGAFDYIAKPATKTRLINALSQATEGFRLSGRRSTVTVGPSGYRGMVGESAPMRTLYEQVERIGRSEISVLLNGESGTGKELVARALHDASPRSKGPFLALNCAAVPESLQDSELFGHERGAFSGANQSRAGKFELAHGGTLFLDEVGNLSGNAQKMLLSVLQEGTITRLGDLKERAVDVKLVVATNED
ncbi:MAG: sigma-54 dependent transcriptional regulator, partial [Myxococcota bacterium]